MTQPTRIVTIVCVALALAAVAVATTYGGRLMGSGHGSVSALAAKHRGPGFSISGHIEGILPGARSPLRLQVHNLERFTIEVKRIRTRVGDAVGGCDGTNVTVGAFRGHLQLKRHARKTVGVPVAMSPTARDRCEGATFPLHFRGRAVRR